MSFLRRADKLCPDGLIDFEGPISRQAGRIPSFVTGATREGIGFYRDEIMPWIISWQWALLTEGAFMNVVEQLKGNYEEAAKLWENYKTRLDAFRGQVKNDCVSMDAQARKVSESAHKMNQAFAGVAATLTSADMLMAIENAERLATALSALNGLTPHKIMFATVDTKA